MRILYVTTISNTINAFLIPHIKLLLENGHQVDIACSLEQEIDSYLMERDCKIFNLEFQRNPFDKRNYIAYKKLEKLIKNGEYDIVHTHTPVASTCVRLACRRMQNVKVFYTAHGFHFFKTAPIRNWLIYYPIEKWLSKYTDILITINNEDFNRAKRSFKAKRVEYIPGVGLEIDKFYGISTEKNVKRGEIGVSEDSFVLLSVGELNKNKNHENIIKAIAKINNNNIYYIICGKGSQNNFLTSLSKKLGVENRIKLLGRREDIGEICKVSDVFVFPSYREGLSVALMEAMACGLPVICSDIRGNRDLIENHKGGYLIRPNDTEGYITAIKKIIEEKESRLQMGLFNISKVHDFDMCIVENKIKRLYELDDLRGNRR